MKIEDVIIIGAGPAGIATAIQLKRYGIEPLVLEKDKIGGLLKNANLVENYPGFPEGISGLNLVKLFEEQVRNIGIKILFEEVIKLDMGNNVFLVETQNQGFQAHIVVIASGTGHREFTALEIPEEVQDKIFYEIYPILGAKGKKIVIVGAGDAAFDYALNLGQNNEVVLLNRSEKIKCFPLLWEKVNPVRKFLSNGVKASNGIIYKENTEISKIMGNSKDRVELECKNSEGSWQLSADYVIFAIGREAQLDYLSQELKENVHKKLYFVGDVKNGMFRQTAIAVGDGVRTAMEIYRRTKEQILWSDGILE